MPELPPIIGAPPRKQRAPTLYAIVAFKLLKGALLLVTSLVIFGLAGTNLNQEFTRVLRDANFDPEGQVFREVLAWLKTVTPGQVRILGTGVVLYSLFSLVEGAGLMIRAAWGAWMAIGESAFFIPVEAFQLAQQFSLSLVIILALNVAVVWYLAANRKRLFHHH